MVKPSSQEKMAVPSRLSRPTPMTSHNGGTLGLYGGSPMITERQKPIPVRRWGDRDLRQVKEALEQESLFYWRGPQTEKLVKNFQQEYHLEHVMSCSSGTAALHIALLAAELKPGDEVITSPITDQGTVIGILYQLGVPIFADIDPETYNIDPQSVAENITPRTKAIIAVHLAGNPCDLTALKAIAGEHNLILIEDCAQAWGSRYRDHPVGTIGDVGCFSLNDYKHISCGDGGLVGCNRQDLGQRLQRCGDKAYDRVGQTRSPEFLAPCYRMSELQAAVASVQIGQVQSIAERRNRWGKLLTDEISEIAGILPPKVAEANFCSYWFYMFRLEDDCFRCTREEFVDALNAEGVSATSGYIPVPLYRFPLFQNRCFFGGEWPIRDMGLTAINYQNVCCANAEKVLETAIRIEIKEWMDAPYITLVGMAIHKVAAHFRS